ncbi:hypothetical protein LDENG_00023180, partial [Lucifuga dentata]
KVYIILLNYFNTLLQERREKSQRKGQTVNTENERGRRVEDRERNERMIVMLRTEIRGHETEGAGYEKQRQIVYATD